MHRNISGPGENKVDVYKLVKGLGKRRIAEKIAYKSLAISEFCI